MTAGAVLDSDAAVPPSTTTTTKHSHTLPPPLEPAPCEAQRAAHVFLEKNRPTLGAATAHPVHNPEPPAGPIGDERDLYVASNKIIHAKSL